MTAKLKEYIRVPNWILIIIVGLFISIFTTGWVKIDNIRRELTIEQTSRCYIEKMLQTIDKKLDKIDERLDKLED